MFKYEVLGRQFVHRYVILLGTLDEADIFLPEFKDCAQEFSFVHKRFYFSHIPSLTYAGFLEQ